MFLIMAKGSRRAITRVGGAMLLMFGKKIVTQSFLKRKKSLLEIELHFISQGAAEL
jgi:hypothetical protein